MGRKLTTEDFIERARKVHGDKYDYSRSLYVNASTKLEIRCTEHGAWMQLPGNHFAGKGCHDCAGLSRLSTEEFVRRSREVHGTRYDYGKSRYVNQKTRVWIICHTHGEFLQLPTEHYRAGSGCNRCASEKRGLQRRLNTDEFVDRANTVHGNRYDYSDVEYKRSTDLVTIICAEHGRFSQTPKDHWAGNGCPRCAHGAPLTTEQFVERANALHGGRYDYRGVEYVTGKVEVSIICPDHGAFRQEPRNHLQGAGCNQCAIALRADKKRLTTEEFVVRSGAVHGDRYDYSSVEYTDNSTSVEIVCSEHGRFLQSPSNHLKGYGCWECTKQRMSDTTESFVAKARNVHGDRYDYSLVEYAGTNAVVTIICPDHGPFTQVPGNHISQGSGCQECAGRAPLTTERFIDKAKATHGNKYDYSLVKCKGGKTMVTIICPEHGPFQQLPTNHYRGKGCSECGGSKPHTTQSFIEAAQAAHGDLYDYSEVEYVNNKTAVTIICQIHGPFSQGAKVHCMGSGCPDCVEGGFSPGDPALLYYLAIATDDGDTRYKIGITNRTVEERFSKNADLNRIRIVRTWRHAVGRIAAEREAEILYHFAGDRYYGPDILVGAGNTELFTHDVLQLDRQDDDHDQTIVDEDAKLASRQVQIDFDF